MFREGLGLAGNQQQVGQERRGRRQFVVGPLGFKRRRARSGQAGAQTRSDGAPRASAKAEEQGGSGGDRGRGELRWRRGAVL